MFIWLEKNGSAEEAQRWRQNLARQDEVNEIASQGSSSSICGGVGMVETVLRSVAGMVLLSAVMLLCLLSGLSFSARVLGRGNSRTGVAISVVTFLGVLGWLTWNTLGGVRTALEQHRLNQGLSGGEGEAVPGAVLAALWREGALVAITALSLPIWLFFVAVLGGRPGKSSRGAILRRYALPLAALFAVIYGVHTFSFGVREQVVHAELTESATHEGRYLAGKLGRAWPE